MCFTIEALLNPVNPVPWADQHRRLFEGCEVSEDADVATIRFTRVVPNPQEWLDLAVLPAHAFASTTIAPDHPFATRAFGSLGMRGVLHEDRATFDHPGGPPPRIGSYELRPDLTLEDVMTGRAHGMVQVPDEQRHVVFESDDHALKYYETGDIWFLAVNRREALADREVRVALDAAIDRNELALDLWGEDWRHYRPEALTGPHLPSSPSYNREIRPRAVEPGPVEGLTRVRLGVGEAQEQLGPGIANGVAEQLRSRGLEVEVVRLPGDPLASGYDREALQDLDLLLVRWVTRPPDHVRPIFERGGSHNPFDVGGPEIERLLADL